MKLKSKVLIGFISALIVMLILGYVSYRSAENTIEENLTRRDINNFNKKLEEISTDIYISQTMEYYFVNTNEVSYLIKLATYCQKLKKDLEELNKNKSSITKYQALKDKFDDVYLNALDEYNTSDNIINIYDFSGLEPTRVEIYRHINSESVSKTFDKIEDFQDRIKYIRNSVDKNADDNANITLLIIPAGSVIAIIIVLVAFSFINFDITEREKAEKALIDLNDSLEIKIAERTAELKKLNSELKIEIEERKNAEKLLRENETILRALIDNIPESVLLLDKEGNIIFSNDTVMKRFNREPRKFIGQNIFDILPPKVAERRKKFNELAIETKQQVRYQDERNGRYMDNYINPVLDSESNIKYLVVLGIDYSELKITERKLIEMLDLSSTMIDESKIGILVYDSESGDCIRANNSAAELVGTSVEILLKQNFRKVETWKSSGLLEHAEIVLQTGISSRKILKFTSTFGKSIWADGIFTRFKSNNRLNLLLMFDDISQRVKAENELKVALNEKELLLKEIHHRVKNNLQIVTSLLNMQSKLIKDPLSLEYFTNSANRVRSMALIHQQLHKSSNLSKINYETYIRDLISHLYKIYCNNNKIILKVNVRGIQMDIDTAIPCGLLINEIITNSFKYAFPDNRNGEIKLEMQRMDDKFILKIGDNGIGIPSDFNLGKNKTIGSELIHLLSQQLEAEMEIKNGNGLEYNFIFKAQSYKNRLETNV